MITRHEQPRRDRWRPAPDQNRNQKLFETDMNYAELLLSAQRAANYSIPRCLRNLSMAVDDGSLLLRAYVSGEPTEEDRDLIYGISCEIGGDFVELSSAGRTEIIVDNGPIINLITLRFVIFSLSD